MRRAERLAKHVVEAIIPGSRMVFNTHQANSECDFTLWLSEDTKAALEVTASVDPEELRAIVAITDSRKGGQFMAATRCRYTWYLQPAPGARIDRIRALADEQLASLEELNILGFELNARGGEHPAATQVAAILRLDSARTLEWIKPAQIIIAMPGRGGMITYESITAALHSEACKLDNRKKLQLAGTNDRHLFVVIDPTSQDAWGAMLVGSQTPSGDPALPPEVTHAWVVCQTSSGEPVRVITYSRITGWQEHGWLALQV